MIKTLELLEKYQPSGLLKNRETQKRINWLFEDSQLKALKPSIKSCLDYYQANLIKQGLLNKDALESNYEAIRSVNNAMWDSLLYQEKNMIANLDGQAIREKLPYFIVDGKHFYIPFLDYRLNHYYTYEMAIFDTKQYFGLYRNFKKYAVDVSIYGGTPYLYLSAGCLCLVNLEDKYVLYDAQHETITVVLNGKDYSFTMADSSKELASLLVGDSEKQLIDYLIDHDLINKKLLKRLKRRVIHVTE
ncbi:MAG: hypothetical protein GX775_00820 [Erysipelothrix sp.]|nr:hypothetical protein [Erysipelothrix sp.]